MLILVHSLIWTDIVVRHGKKSRSSKKIVDILNPRIYFADT